MTVDEGATSLPLVSIIVPTYNRATLILRALDSIFQQIIEGDEVIVVDDGSTDDTESVLKPYRDRIVFVNAPHGGAGKARNIGLRTARNSFIGFLDSDDEWMPGKLTLQRVLLQNRPDVLFCFSDLGYRYESGEEERELMKHDLRRPNIRELLGPGTPFSEIAALPRDRCDFLVHVGDLYPGQMEREFLQVNTLLFRRADIDFQDVRFPEDLRTREDWEFVGRLARKGLAAYLDCETTWLYKHAGPQLTKLGYLIYLEDRLKLLERVWGSDREFLTNNREQYQKVHDDVYWCLIREYLCRGEMARVRTALASADNVPWQYSLLSRQPGAVNRFAFKLRDMVFGA